MKKGFTLLELLLVVVLMGIVYGSISNIFEQYKEKKIDVTLMSLQNYMQNYAYNSHVSLVCIKQCGECLLFVNEKFKQNVTPFIEKNVELFRYDKDLSTQKLTIPPYFTPDGQEEEVCFRYDIQPDTSKTEMIVKNKNDVYVFSSFFGSVKKYESLDEAIGEQNRLAQKVAK